MLLTLKMKLITTDVQHKKLLQTMERFNEACDFVSDFAFQNKTFGKILLQKHLYREIRDKFSLSAQMAVRTVGKVSESYQTDWKCKHKFDPHGAMVYDQRILSFKSLETCSILTLEGRETVNIAYGGYQTLDLNRVLGIVNIATTSNGQQFSGKQCTEVRKKYSTIKAKLQSVQTWNAKKHLKEISGRERRFKRDVNHCISKSIVALAKDTLSGIALENLTGIRERVTGYRELRASIGKWAFFEIASFIQYKAQVLGVPVYFVDPRNTSKQCSKCGFIDKDNRKTQSEFFCLQCGHKDNADVNAAKNIAQRAVVNQPIALCLEPKGSMRLKCKPTTLVVGS